MPRRYYSNAAVPTSLSASIPAAALSANLMPTDAAAGFEDGSLGGWQAASSATGANSAAQAHTGTHSLALTMPLISAATVVAYIAAPGVPDVPGDVRTVSMWVFSTATCTAAAEIIWNTSAQASAGASAVGTATAVLANTWTELVVSGTAPATTAYAYPALNVSTATSGQIIYLDDVQIEPGSVATPFRYPSYGSVTNISVASKTGYPTAFPFTMTIDKNQTGLGEAVEAVGVGTASATDYWVHRGIDHTTSQAHNSGALVSHDHTARDYDDTQEALDRVQSLAASFYMSGY